MEGKKKKNEGQAGKLRGQHSSSKGGGRGQSINSTNSSKTTKRQRRQRTERKKKQKTGVNSLHNTTCAPNTTTTQLERGEEGQWRLASAPHVLCGLLATPHIRAGKCDGPAFLEIGHSKRPVAPVSLSHAFYHQSCRSRGKITVVN